MKQPITNEVPSQSAHGYDDTVKFNRRMSWISTISSVIIATGIAGSIIYLARPILLPITAAFIFSIVLTPAAEWLRRFHIPASIRAFVVVCVALSIFVGAIYLALQPGAVWLENLPDVVAQAKAKLIGVQEAMDKVKDVSNQVKELTELDNKGNEKEITVENSKPSESIIANAPKLFIQIAFSAVLAFYFVAGRVDFHRKLMMFQSDFRGMRRMVRMLRALERQVGTFMLTMLVINIGLGVFTGTTMWILGMPSPLVWGALAACLNFIPYLGPLLMVSLLAISAVVNFDTLVSMALPVVLYAIYNFFEANFVTPKLMGVRLTISPLAIILNISFWTWIWGPVGAIISIPVLIIFKIICDYSKFLTPIGLLIGDADTFRPRKSKT